MVFLLFRTYLVLWLYDYLHLLLLNINITENTNPKQLNCFELSYNIFLQFLGNVFNLNVLNHFENVLYKKNYVYYSKDIWR